MTPQANFWDLVTGYETFSGVSFVGSFKILEEELLPRFRQVNLVLGMEDRKTGQNLDQLFNIQAKVTAVLGASPTFLDRLEDGTLDLRFTRDRLFHSKYFLVEGSRDFLLFNGSMNLTNKALHENHELVWLYRGQKDNPADQAIYRAHHELFAQNFTTDSVAYLDRKIIGKLREGNAQEATALIADQLVDQVHDATVVVNKEELGALLNEEGKNEVAYAISPATKETVRAVYTPKGNRRRDPAKVKTTVKQIAYQHFAPVKGVAEAADFYPAPLWSYADGKLLVQNPGNQLFHALTAPENLVGEEDVRTFVDVIRSFKENKVRDESPQALAAFLYLMTAPLIWKIRQVYRDSNFARSADQVPLSLVLIGRGTTGKTLLVRDYFKPFIGDHGSSVQYADINGGSLSRTERAVAFLDQYLHSDRFVSPMIVDELNGNFLHGKPSTNAIKQWSNSLTGIHNVNIFAMNHNAADKDINNLEEITKRVYYLSFEAGWKKADQQTINYQILENSLNDHLYRSVVSQLNERLVNLTGEDEERLVKDYLSLTKEILAGVLDRYGYGEEFAPLLSQNYDYKVDRNRLTWKMLIKDDDFKHVSFSSDNDQQFTVSKAIFNTLRGSSYENINQTLDNYFNMFPRAAGVTVEQYDNGMVLDIDHFDAFIGEPLIRKHYRRLHQKEREQATMTDFLKAQQARNQQQDAYMRQMMAKMAEKEAPKEKPGLFGRLFGRH